MRYLSVAIILLCLALVSPLAAQAAQPTPPVTQDPMITPQPQASPTPWVVIMVTATPDLHPTPPSLQIPDLDKKIKKAFGKAPGFGAANWITVPIEIEETIDLFMSWLVGRQVDYRQMTGRYAQMLPSHVSGIPQDGAHAYPDGWYTHPTDQQYSWDNLRAIQYEPIPFMIQVDTYDGPEGQGFVACFSMILNGQRIEKCHNYGGEALQAIDWTVIP